MSFNANIKPGLSQNWPWAHLTDERYTLSILSELTCTNHSHLSVCRATYFSHLYSEKQWNPVCGLRKKGNEVAGRIAKLHMKITTVHSFPSDRSSSSKLFPPEDTPCFFKAKTYRVLLLFVPLCSLSPPLIVIDMKRRTWRSFPCLFCHVF